MYTISSPSVTSDTSGARLRKSEKHLAQHQQCSAMHPRLPQTGSPGTKYLSRNVQEGANYGKTPEEYRIFS